MVKSNKTTPEIKAKLLIEEVKFSLMITDNRQQILVAMRIQRERMETLTEYGIVSEYERSVSENLLNIYKNK